MKLSFSLPQCMSAYRHHYLLLLANFVVFGVLKYSGLFSITQPWVHLPVILLVLIMGRHTRMKDASIPYRILMRTILGLFLFYLALSYPTLPDEVIEPGGYHWLMFYWGRPIALAAGIVGMVYPVAGIVLLLFVGWYKTTLAQLAGVTISATDYYSILECGIFLIIGLLLSTRLPRHPTLPVWHTTEVLVLAAIALHLSNYGYSALQKLRLGDTPLSWLLENNTHNLMMSAEAMGMLPLLAHEGLTRWAHLFVSQHVLWMNLCIMGAQCFAFFALQRIRWVIILTVLYDLTHIAIFLLSGIFFWKWIVFNLGIIAALRPLRHRQVPWPLSLPLAAITLLAPLLFYVTFLGWYDTASVNKTTVIAVMKDGSEYEVPPHYFLAYSLPFSQQRFGSGIGGFPVGTLGTTLDRDLMHKANRCELETTDTALTDETRHIVSTLILWPHRYRMEHEQLPFNLYPHHIWAAPQRYQAFLHADTRNIQRFDFSIESLCMRLDEHGYIHTSPRYSRRIPITP